MIGLFLIGERRLKQGYGIALFFPAHSTSQLFYRISKAIHVEKSNLIYFNAPILTIDTSYNNFCCNIA